MIKRKRGMSFQGQMRRSIAEIQSIMERHESPSGNERFTVRTMEVAEPSMHGAKSVRAIRQSLNVSQPVFAQLLGVSAALVRAWELGARVPAPIARRLLDQVRTNRSAFVSLVRAFDATSSSRGAARTRNVA